MGVGCCLAQEILSWRYWCLLKIMVIWWYSDDEKLPLLLYFRHRFFVFIWIWFCIKIEYVGNSQYILLAFAIALFSVPCPFFFFCEKTAHVASTLARLSLFFLSYDKKEMKMSPAAEESAHSARCIQGQTFCGCGPFLKIWLLPLWGMKGFENLAWHINTLNTGQCWEDAQFTKRNVWGQGCIGLERTLWVNESLSLLSQAAVLEILIIN